MIVYELLRKKAAANRLIFYIGQIHSFTFQGITPVLQLGFGVQNVNNQSFTINSFAGNVYAIDVDKNKTLIGNLSDFNHEVIPANSQGTLFVSVRLNALAIINDLYNAFSQGSIPMSIVVDANANVDNLIIPIKQTIPV